MKKDDWSSFWKREGNAFNAIMEINTQYFARQFRKLGIKKDDTILDYGCGPGLLEDALVPLGFNVTGVDINESFIDDCQRKYPDLVFITISSDVTSSNEILLRTFHDKKFDYIVLLSILQYFSDHSQIESLFTMLRRFLKPGGSIILADVVGTNTSSVRDLISLTFHSMAAGKIIALFQFVFYLLFSRYRTISKNKPLLVLSSETVQRMAEKHSFSFREVSGLTIHATRKNYILVSR